MWSGSQLRLRHSWHPGREHQWHGYPWRLTSKRTRCSLFFPVMSAHWKKCFSLSKETIFGLPPTSSLNLIAGEVFNLSRYIGHWLRVARWRKLLQFCDGKAQQSNLLMTVSLVEHQVLSSRRFFPFTRSTVFGAHFLRCLFAGQAKWRLDLRRGRIVAPQ